MQEYDKLTPAERELESALGLVRPAGHAIDRDQLFYAAGVRRGRQARHGWQACSGLLAGLLAASWLIRPAGPGEARFADVGAASDSARPVRVVVDEPPSPPARAVVVPPELLPVIPLYVRLRNLVVAEGPDALPEAQTRAVPAGRLEPSTTYPRAFGPDRSIGA
jgi:hypothetical protein